MAVHTTSQGLETETKTPSKPAPTICSAKVRVEAVVSNSSPSRLWAACAMLPTQLTMTSHSARSS